MVTQTAQGPLVQEVLTANQAYVKDFGDKGSLPLPPGGISPF